MTDRRTVKITSPQSRARAHALIDAAPVGYCVAIGEETRTQEQNRLMWPLIRDVREQVPGMDELSADDTKLQFLHALGQEMRFLPELEGAGMFPVGQRSSTLSKAQFSALIEIIFAFGSARDVRWSDRSLEVREAV